MTPSSIVFTVASMLNAASELVRHVKYSLLQFKCNTPLCPSLSSTGGGEGLAASSFDNHIIHNPLVHLMTTYGAYTVYIANNVVVTSKLT